MNILLLGGYGVFGARLAQLLIADGHDISIAGRNLEKARSCAKDLGCRAIRIDRAGQLVELPEYDVVADAAEVPDQRLFPAHFGAETVRFRAGLELPVMRYGLALFAGVRRVVPLSVSWPIVRVFKVLADLLARFGSGREGMCVSVTTRHEHRSWPSSSRQISSTTALAGSIAAKHSASIRSGS